MRSLALIVSLVVCPFVYAAPVDSACCIQILDNEGNLYSAGSGTVIACEKGKSLIITCAHVVENGDKHVLIWLNGKTYNAKYIAGSKVTVDNDKIKIYGKDLALIEVDAVLPVAALGTASPKVNDKIRQWGFAGGSYEYGPLYKEGKVVGLERETQTGKETFSTADARPGDSGSGLFDSNDKMIGITNLRPPDFNAVGGYAIRIEDARDWLKDKTVGFDKFKDTLK